MQPTSPLLKVLLATSLALAVGTVLSFVIGLPLPTLPTLPPPQPAARLTELSPAESLSTESPAESVTPGRAAMGAPLWHPTAATPPQAAASATLPQTADAPGRAVPRSPTRPGRAGHPTGPVAAPAGGTSVTVQTFQRDPGVPVPVSFVSLDEVSLSEPQAQKLNEMATDFLQAVEASPDVSAAWQAERVRTDQRFKTLYGRDLYMRQMLNAAREARGQAMLPAP